MIKLTNIGLSCANCTTKCRPISINGTVVRKSSLGPKSWSEPHSIQGRLTAAPWAGSRTPVLSGQILAAFSPSQSGCRFSSTASSPASLYETLGVSPKATHKEIKAAYYNLSMTYHPDKNSNCDVAARKFREITAAYEVLGNFMNRKKYDRGFVPHEAAGPTQEANGGKVRGSYETSRGKHYRSQVSVHMGRTTIYDFDEWTKIHYGETFAKKKAQRERYDRHMAKLRDHEGDKHVELMMTTIAFLMVVLTYMATLSSYDDPHAIVQNSSEDQSRLLAESDS